MSKLKKGKLRLVSIEYKDEGSIFVSSPRDAVWMVYVKPQGALFSISRKCKTYEEATQTANALLEANPGAPHAWIVEKPKFMMWRHARKKT